WLRYLPGHHRGAARQTCGTRRWALEPDPRRSTDTTMVGQRRDVLENPWLHDATDVADALGVDIDASLSTAEASERLRRYGRNELESARQVPAWRRFLSEFADPL